jgi:hypothetical protein
MFDLLKTAALWVADFVIDDDESPLDPKYSDFAPKKSSKSSSFLDFDFIKSGAKAYVAASDRGGEKSYMQPTPIPRPRSIGQLTRGNPSRNYKAPAPVRVGYFNADMRSAMRALSNPTNRQVAQLIPYNMIQPRGKPKATIAVGSTDLGKIG